MMKKFEEELDKKVGTFDVVGHHNGVCCLVEEVKALGKDWVSPEDHILEIKENQRLRGIIGDMSSKIGKLKSQLENQQPEIPEFVAELFNEYRFESVQKLFEFGSDDIKSNMMIKALQWRDKNPNIFALAFITANYTVAKEKRFYLKNKLTEQYLYHAECNTLDELPDFDEDSQFTQKEIASMETGSYEQIEVEE